MHFIQVQTSVMQVAVEVDQVPRLAVRLCVAAVKDTVQTLPELPPQIQAVVVAVLNLMADKDRGPLVLLLLDFNLKFRKIK